MIEAYEFLSCSLVVYSGPFCDLGQLERMINIEAIGIQVPRFRDLMRVAVITRQERSGELVEIKPSPNPLAIARLVAALRAVEFPARAPTLEAVVSTGDHWERLRLHVTLDQATASFELNMESDGFGGRDAAKWRTVFHCILRVADQLGDRVPLWARD